jgi:hypothetical protein
VLGVDFLDSVVGVEGDDGHFAVVAPQTDRRLEAVRRFPPHLYPADRSVTLQLGDPLDLRQPALATDADAVGDADTCSGGEPQLGLCGEHEAVPPVLVGPKPSPGADEVAVGVAGFRTDILWRPTSDSNTSLMDRPGR